MKPVAVDLYAGKGGWAKGLKAAGFHVIGFDIDPAFARDYPGDEFRAEDVRFVLHHVHSSKAKFGLSRSLNEAAVVVASPPCEEFSRHQMPWTLKRNPPQPDLSLVKAAQAIAREIKCPLILENVRKAQDWLGRAEFHFGPFYLWGEVPALMPKFQAEHYRKKESLSSTAKAERAMIPYDLALHIGRCFLPSPAPTRDAGGVE